MASSPSMFSYPSIYGFPFGHYSYLHPSIALINKYKPGKCIPLAPATTTTCLQYPITPRKAPRSDNQTKQTNTNRSAEIPRRDPKEIPVRTSHARSRCQQVAWLAAQKV